MILVIVLCSINSYSKNIIGNSTDATMRDDYFTSTSKQGFSRGESSTNVVNTHITNSTDIEYLNQERESLEKEITSKESIISYNEEEMSAMLVEIEELSQQISDDMTQPASGNTPQQNSEEKLQQTSEDNPQQTSLSTNRPTATNQQATANYQTKLASAKNERHSSTSKSEKWSIGLTASGGLLALVHQDTYYSGDYYADDPNKYHSPESITNGNSPNEYLHYPAYKHHLPMRLGLSLHYQLNDALALQSGINYTYLYSESITHIDNQHLHYLGIPIGLSWQLWKTNGFSFYLSGSAMLEKCLNEKPWQWSLGAAAGAEYSFTSHVGVYLQPSLSYYFNDGTSFEHYYKEHPLAPAIEFGLRLHVFDK